MGFPLSVIHLAVMTMDRYFAHCHTANTSTNTSTSQLSAGTTAPLRQRRYCPTVLLNIGCACLWIAFKLEKHHFDFDMDRFLDLFTAYFTPSQSPTLESLIEQEKEILGALQFDLYAPTVNVFLTLYVHLAMSELHTQLHRQRILFENVTQATNSESNAYQLQSQELRELRDRRFNHAVENAVSAVGSIAKCICERALLSYEMLSFVPSQIAAAAIHMAFLQAYSEFCSNRCHPNHQSEHGMNETPEISEPMSGMMLMQHVTPVCTGYTLQELSGVLTLLKRIFRDETYQRARCYGHQLLLSRLQQREGCGGQAPLQQSASINSTSSTSNTSVRTMTYDSLLQALHSSGDGASDNVSTTHSSAVSYQRQQAYQYHRYVPLIFEHLESSVKTELIHLRAQQQQQEQYQYEHHELCEYSQLTALTTPGSRSNNSSAAYDHTDYQYPGHFSQISSAASASASTRTYTTTSSDTFEGSRLSVVATCTTSVAVDQVPSSILHSYRVAATTSSATTTSADGMTITAGAGTNKSLGQQVLQNSAACTGSGKFTTSSTSMDSYTVHDSDGGASANALPALLFLDACVQQGTVQTLGYTHESVRLRYKQHYSKLVTCPMP